MTNGLYTLVVNTSENIDDLQQAYVAGYAEGDLTGYILDIFY